jgi:hypothetical protein
MSYERTKETRQRFGKGVSATQGMWVLRRGKSAERDELGWDDLEMRVGQRERGDRIGE